MTTTLLKGGLVVDGTGTDKFRADLLLENDCIVEVGYLDGSNFDHIYDINGLAVAPGFIDTHSHSDLELLINPAMEPKIRQGITTEVLGQDGISVAPLPSSYVNIWRKNLAGLAGDSDHLKWEWKSTDDYLQLLEKKGTGTNILYLIPHGNIRLAAMGLKDKRAEPLEIQKMKEFLADELTSGAAGLSTGLIYTPCAYAQTEELIELCKIVAAQDKVFVVHQRSEADTIIESMEEVLRIGRESGVKIHFSHFKICGKNNWDKIDIIEELLNKAKAEGLIISYDQYPYIVGSTMLSIILPPWVFDGGVEEALKRLQDQGEREKIKHDIINGIAGWDNFLNFAGFDGIYITSLKTDKNKWCIGKSLIEIAERRGVEPFSAVFDLLTEEENAVGMYDYYGCEENVIRLMQRPEQNFCTDGLLGGMPHPRVYGTYPRALGKYHREQQALPLEEAIYKMTLKPAQVFGLSDRGKIAEGMKADLVIFNPQTIIDKATFINPRQFPGGIQQVILNGKIVLDHGERFPFLTGRVIRINNRKGVV